MDDEEQLRDAEWLEEAMWLLDEPRGHRAAARRHRHGVPGRRGADLRGARALPVVANPGIGGR